MHYEVRLNDSGDMREFSNFSEACNFLTMMIEKNVPTIYDVGWEIPIEKNEILFNNVSGQYKRNRPLGYFVSTSPAEFKTIKQNVNAYIIITTSNDWPPDEHFFGTISKIYDDDKYNSQW